MQIRNGIYAALFMLMVSIPLIFMDLTADKISVVENRRLANPPNLIDIRNSPGTFIRRFDEWFTDNIGFREKFLSLYYVMSRNRWLNGAVSREGNFIYLFGGDGHVFIADQLMLSKFQGKPIFNDTELAYLAARLQEVSAFLEKKGIPLLVMLCPDKETVYPELYPKSVIRGPDPIPFEVVKRFLQVHTTADVFCITEALKAEKENFLLYPKIDHIVFAPQDVAHYNEIAAFFGYQELMRYIQVYYPEMTYFDISDVDISYDEFNQPRVYLNPEKVSSRRLDSSFFDDVNIVRPFTIEHTAYENEDSSLPVILFIRDSYTYEYYTEKYIPQHFSKSIFIRNTSTRYFEEYVIRYQPDIVVFEAGERGLRLLYNFISEMPKLP